MSAKRQDIKKLKVQKSTKGETQMAKNYLFSEAVEIIGNGTDLEAIVEIGKRFPIMSIKVAKCTALAGEDFVDLMSFMPELLTANKVNTLIKKTIEESDEVEDGEETEEEETTTPTTKRKVGQQLPDDVDDEFTGKTSRELYQIASHAGLLKGMKSTKKVDLLIALRENAGSTPEEEEEEEVENDYTSMKAMELFKLAKERGIKVASKKPAKFYIDLLVADDAKEEEVADDDDWDEEEEEVTETKTKTKAKPATTKPKNKAKVKATATAEEDDWDI